MSTGRAIAECTFNGNGKCGNPGTLYPILCLPPPPPYPRSNYAKLVSNVPTCPRCGESVTIESFLLPEARAKISTGFIMAGTIVPDFDGAWLEWGTIVPDFDGAWLEWGEVGDSMWRETNAAVTANPHAGKPN